MSAASDEQNRRRRLNDDRAAAALVGVLSRVRIGVQRATPRRTGTPTDDEVAEDVLALLLRIRAHLTGESPLHPSDSTKRAA